MTSSDNPFKDLEKRLFPPKEGGPPTAAGNAGAASKSNAPSKTGLLHKGASVVAQGRQQNSPAIDDSDDAALFIQSVRNIAPLHSKKFIAAPSGDNSFAEALGLPTASVSGQNRPSVTQKPPLSKKTTAQQHPSLQAVEDMWSASTPAPPPEDDLFFKAMQGVQPVEAKGRDVQGAKVEAPQTGGAQNIVLQHMVEYQVEFALSLTDEYMEGFVTGLDPLVLGQLRAGYFPPETRIDLHGHNSVQAHDVLIGLVKNAYQRNMRTLLVITGRGKNAPDGTGVLRAQLQEWLIAEPFKRVVLAFCTAQLADGGPGAVYVMLRKYKKSRSKILWERNPSMNDPI